MIQKITLVNNMSSDSSSFLDLYLLSEFIQFMGGKRLNLARSVRRDFVSGLFERKARRFSPVSVWVKNLVLGSVLPVMVEKP